MPRSDCLLHRLLCPQHGRGQCSATHLHRHPAVLCRLRHQAGHDSLVSTAPLHGSCSTCACMRPIPCVWGYVAGPALPVPACGPYHVCGGTWWVLPYLCLHAAHTMCVGGRSGSCPTCACMRPIPCVGGLGVAPACQLSLSCAAAGIGTGTQSSTSSGAWVGGCGGEAVRGGGGAQGAVVVSFYWAGDSGRAPMWLNLIASHSQPSTCSHPLAATH